MVKNGYLIKEIREYFNWRYWDYDIAIMRYLKSADNNILLGNFECLDVCKNNVEIKSSSKRKINTK